MRSRPYAWFVIVLLLAAVDRPAVAGNETGAGAKPGPATDKTGRQGPESAAEADQRSAAGGVAGSGDGGNDAIHLPVVLPEHPTSEPDAYLCTSVPLPDRPLKLVGIASNSDQRVVHHMLLFGCKDPAETAEVWDCRMRSACASTGSENVLYGWGKNAAAMTLPPGVAFSVGPGTSIRTVVLQIHYLEGRGSNDTSGVTLTLSPTPAPNSAGMVAFAAAFTIPPRRPDVLVKNACCYAGWEPLHGFASRAHTHALGREVYLDHGLAASGETRRVISLDPQKPQGFYPIEGEVTFLPGDNMAMACRFNSSSKAHAVSAGHTHTDEMCNNYVMTYSQLPTFMWCLDGRPWLELGGAGGVPADGQLVPETAVWQPPAAIPQPPSSNGSSGAQGGAAAFPLGQVPGVASAGDGTVWIFHRGDQDWLASGAVGNASSADEAKTLLAGPAVAQLDQDTGRVLRAWGASQFVLPHMLSLDWEGNVWLTDLALHQAFKFSPAGEQLLALGTRAQAGDGPQHFCKPTQVAVARSGNVFVSDGYCNSRVAEFGPDGGWLRDYVLPPSLGAMSVPHSLVLHECRRQLLVADRESGAVHAFQMGQGRHLGSWQLQQEGLGLPYALALGPYGSVLALSWERDVPQPRTLLVALGAQPGELSGQWEVPGVEVPHDLALAPAPLQQTGAGERLLAFVIVETRDSGGHNLQKVVLVPAGAELVGGLEGAGRSIAGTAADAAVDQPAGVQASHIGHVMLKPVDAGTDGGDGPSSKQGGEQQAAQSAARDDPPGNGELPEARVGHTMVAPVNSTLEDRPDAARQTAGADGHEDSKAAAGGGGSKAAEPQEDKVAAGGKHDAAATAAASHAGKQPAGSNQTQPAPKTVPANNPPPRVHRPKQQRQSADGGTPEPPQAASDEEISERKQEALRLEQQAAAERAAKLAVEAAEERAARLVEREGEVVAKEDSAEREEVEEDEDEEQAWHPTHEQSAMFGAWAQPGLLGLVFLSVALVSWNRLQQWRQHGGAGYDAPSHQHGV